MTTSLESRLSPTITDNYVNESEFVDYNDGDDTEVHLLPKEVVNLKLAPADYMARAKPHFRYDYTDTRVNVIKLTLLSLFPLLVICVPPTDLLTGVEFSVGIKIATVPLGFLIYGWSKTIYYGTFRTT